MPEVRPIDANALNFEKLQDTNNEAIPALEYIAFLKGAIAAEEMIKNAPTLDYEPVVHAHWIEGFDHKHLFGWCRCSACGRGIVHDFLGRFQKSRRCPNCGAKMDEEVK